MVTTNLGLRHAAAAGATAALVFQVAPASAQPAPPQANWTEFAQLAAYGLLAYDPHNSCNQQPYACASSLDICNWIDANTIETLADYAIATGDNLGGRLDVLAGEASCWYVNGVGLPNTTPENPWNSLPIDGDPGYNDDALWWANAFIRLYDYSNNTNYLTYAEQIFAGVSVWWNDSAPGSGVECPEYGIPWRPESSFDPNQEVNSITNELFLQTATALAVRTCQTETEPWCFLPGTHTLDPNEPHAIYPVSGNGNGLTFVQWAVKEWNWFNTHFMYDDDYQGFLVADRLEYPCSPRAGTVYTYNNGVIFGGLTGLAQIEAQWPGHTGASPQSYLDVAYGLASDITAGNTALTYSMPNLGPIVIEPACTLAANCDGGTQQFKGIFMRYLGRLNTWQTLGIGPSYGTPDQYDTFITNNAASLWTGTRQCAGAGLSSDPGAGFADIFGEDWRGLNGYASTQSTQNAAVDLLVAATVNSASDAAKTLAVAVLARISIRKTATRRIQATRAIRHPARRELAAPKMRLTGTTPRSGA